MSETLLYCNRCGAGNPAGAQTCSRCGASVAGNSEDLVPHGFIFQADEPAMPPVTVTTPAIEPAAPPIYVPASFPSPFATLEPVSHSRYGGFWIRLVAVIIDWVAVEMIVIPIGFLTGVMIGVAGAVVGMPSLGIRLVSVIVGITLGFCGSWIYEASLESSSRQATLGKMALSLKVTDLEGKRISFARATGRHFSKYLSGLILCAGYIMAGLTERKQALHDMIAGTLVERR